MRIRPGAACAACAWIWAASGIFWTAAIIGLFTGYDDEPGFGSFDRRIWLLILTAAAVTSLTAGLTTLLTRNVAQRVDRFYATIAKTAMQIRDDIIEATGPQQPVTMPGDGPDGRPLLRAVNGAGRHTRHANGGGPR